MTEERTSISLNKYISDTGLCSRREANKLIEQGKVTLNGKVAQLGNRVEQGDEVKLNGKLIGKKPKTVFIMLHKPRGIICTTDTREPKNIIDFIDHHERIFPIGRIDKPSEGLIFLTNDGNIVNKILRAENKHEKEYIVRVDKPITDQFLKKMSSGIPILGTITKKCKVEQINKVVFRIILTQGLNRQIRRMCEYLDYDVKSLKRVRIMNIKLGKLAPGQWRNLTQQEMNAINEKVKGSRK